MSTGGFSLMVDNSHDKLCPVMVPILDNRAPATEQSSPWFATGPRLLAAMPASLDPHFVKTSTKPPCRQDMSEV